MNKTGGDRMIDELEEERVGILRRERRERIHSHHWVLTGY